MNSHIAQYIDMGSEGTTVFPVGVEPHTRDYSFLTRILLTITENIYAFSLPIVLIAVVKVAEIVRNKKLKKSVWNVIYLSVFVTEMVIFILKFKNNGSFNYY